MLFYIVFAIIGAAICRAKNRSIVWGLLAAPLAWCSGLVAAVAVGVSGSGEDTMMFAATIAVLFAAGTYLAGLQALLPEVDSYDAEWV